MIHKQYMDLLNTSPTYIFPICVIVACKGLKLSSIQKEYVALSSHTKRQRIKETRGPPFAMVKNIHEGLSTSILRYTRRQKSETRRV